MQRGGRGGCGCPKPLLDISFFRSMISSRFSYSFLGKLRGAQFLKMQICVDVSFEMTT